MPIILALVALVAIAFTAYLILIVLMVAFVVLLAHVVNIAISMILTAKAVEYDDTINVFFCTYPTMVVAWYAFMKTFYVRPPDFFGAHELEAFLWPITIVGHLMNRNDYSVVWPFAVCYFFSTMAVSFTYYWDKRSRLDSQKSSMRGPTLSTLSTFLITTSMLLIPAYYTMLLVVVR